MDERNYGNKGETDGTDAPTYTEGGSDPAGSNAPTSGSGTEGGSDPADTEGGSGETSGSDQPA